MKLGNFTVKVITNELGKKIIVVRAIDLDTLGPDDGSLPSLITPFYVPNAVLDDVKKKKIDGITTKWDKEAMDKYAFGICVLQTLATNFGWFHLAQVNVMPTYHFLCDHPDIHDDLKEVLTNCIVEYSDKGTSMKDVSEILKDWRKIAEYSRRSI